MKKKVSQASFINYEHFAKTYLLIAKIVLLEKEKTLHKEKLSDDDHWRLQKLIAIPSIYCVRHGVELFLKSIEVGTNKTYANTHDLDELRKVIGANCSSLIDIDSFTEVVKKYLNYDFVTPITTATEQNYDSMNEVFRFPENTNGIKIVGENLKDFKTEEISQDIEKLSYFFNVISTNWQLNK
jgi:hypothetical protein